MTSISAIAEVSNSPVFSSLGVVSEQGDASGKEAVSGDTVKVKKTDYPQDVHGEDFSLDLKDPDNLKPDTAVYDEKSGLYKVGTRLGDNFLSQPWMMTPDEYLKWSEQKSFRDYFKVRNDSLFTTKGKEKFDFTNMHFDLGPAEKIFGPGGVQIRTQGSAEMKFGYNYKFGCSYGGHNFKVGRDCDAELAKLQALLDECNSRQPQVITKEVIKEVPKEVIKYVEKPGIAMENLKVVPFEVNKWYLSDAAQSDLNTIPAGAHVQVIGTASPEGPASWNQELSDNRAKAVCDYLQERGVIVDSCEGHGVEGKTSNRLAIVYITSRPQ